MDPHQLDYLMSSSLDELDRFLLEDQPQSRISQVDLAPISEPLDPLIGNSPQVAAEPLDHLIENSLPISKHLDPSLVNFPTSIDPMMILMAQQNNQTNNLFEDPLQGKLDVLLSDNSVTLKTLSSPNLQTGHRNLEPVQFSHPIHSININPANIFSDIHAGFELLFNEIIPRLKDTTFPMTIPPPQSQNKEPYYPMMVSSCNFNFLPQNHIFAQNPLQPNLLENNKDHGLSKFQKTGTMEMINKDDGDNCRRNMKNKLKKKKRAKGNVDNLQYEDVKKYFDIPIAKAAEALDVGLTRFKRRCRDLQIWRWPHRKVRSIKCLMKSAQELGLEHDPQLLEEEEKMMLELPHVELNESTKRLRQACFKANYKKRIQASKRY